MRSLWACLTLASLCASTLAAWQCPAGCECGGAGETLVSCGQTNYKVRDDGYIEVDCQGSVLSCSSVPPLPPLRTLRHLELVGCAVGRGAGGCVSAAAGGGAGGPAVLYTRGLRGNLTEGALEGLEGVQQIVMHDATVQQTLPPLSSLPHLTSFRIVGGAHLVLTPSLPPSLTYLEIIGSGVTSLSGGVFEGLSHLETLHIYQNDIETVDYEDLAPLSSLRELSVMFAPVRRLRVAPLTSLEVLTLGRVALRDLREGDLSNMPNLRQLEVKSSPPLRLGPLSLSSLPSLSSLRLPQCQLTSLPPSLLLNSPSLVNVTFAWNNITSIPVQLFYNMSVLEWLDLSHNLVSDLSAGTFDSLASVREILLDHNKLSTLPTRLFSPCTSLQSLSLSHNSLTSLPSPTFPPSLLHLRLSHNLLASPSPSPLVGEYDIGPYFPSPFNSLTELQTLDLSHNLLGYMFPDLRQVLLNLHQLDLSYNQFNDLLKSDTEFLNFNITVDLRHNNVSNVDPHLRYFFTSDSDATSTTASTSQTILLSNNPYICDCLLYPLLHNIKDTTYNIDAAVCQRPSSLNGTRLLDLRLDELYCKFTGGDFPSNPHNCSCLYRPNKDRYECTCSIIDVTCLPRPYELNVKYLALKLTENNHFDFLPEFVNELNVSGIGLTDFDYNVSNVELIDLSFNKLGKIPLKYLRGNHSLYLRGNPVECDCWNSEFIFELHKYSDKILDYEVMLCSNGGRVSVVDTSALCDVYTATIVGSTLAIIGVIAAVFISVCWRYKSNIKVYLSTIPGLEFLDDEDVEGREYDVFVSFSHEDFAFIRDVLMPVLDKEYKVCVHYREWEVGQTIPIQIHRSVTVSRRTIVVLSKHYIRSRWAVAEFREATAHGKLVLLILEDVDRNDLPQDLRDYIASTTYLEVTDPRFWEKLRRALPRRPLKSLEKSTGQEVTPAATPTSTSPLNVGATPFGLSDQVTLPIGLADPGKKAVGLAEPGKKAVGLADPGKKAVGLADPKQPAIDVILNKHGQLVNRGFVKDV